MGSIDDLIRDLRRFHGRAEVTKQLRQEIRRPIPQVRQAIKERALATLPKSGGLNRWAARTKVTARIRLAGRAAGVQLKGSRASTGGKADLRRMDAGRVRHPSWGRRARSQWHNQQVPPGYFTGPAAEIDQWRDACVRAVDQALEVIRGG